MDGHRVGWHSGRSEAAFDHCRPARSRASVFRDVGRGCAPIMRPRSDMDALLKGLDVVEGFDAGEPTFHDPHCIRLCPSNTNRMYQQNHCGIYRLDRPSDTWLRIGKNMPQQVGNRISDGDSSARCRYRVGVPHGRHFGKAAHPPRRQARSLRNPRWRRDVGASRCGFSIIEVSSREEAHAWAVQIAAACRCTQVVREIMFDPES